MPKGKKNDATKAKPENTESEATQPCTPSIGAGKVETIPLESIDLDDITFMFRAVIRVGDLKRSLQQEGQQIPIIIRRTQGKKKYQIISGFRRVTAAMALGWTKIAVIVRTGLSDDGAFRAAVLENTARKTYSDIDRAHIIRAYRKTGNEGDEIARLMNLTKRQVRNLLSLLELPDSVQDAIDDPDQYFSTTHALTLKQLKSNYSDLKFDPWVQAVNNEELSVSQLKRRVNKEHDKEAKAGFTSLFMKKGTDWRKGAVRFASVKVKLGDLTVGEKKKLKGELERVLKKLG